MGVSPGWPWPSVTVSESLCSGWSEGAVAGCWAQSQPAALNSSFWGRRPWRAGYLFTGRCKTAAAAAGAAAAAAAEAAGTGALAAGGTNEDSR